MKLKTKTAFVIPAGTIVTKEMMEWIIANCNKLTNCELPNPFADLFGGFGK